MSRALSHAPVGENRADVAALPHPDQASLFLDFDGTLVDLAETPDAITIPDALPDLLDRLAARLNGRLALVSGRAVSDIAHHLPDYRGIIVGGHGAELRDTADRVARLAGDAETTAQLHDWARETASDNPGLRSELKRTGAALHYRQAPELEEAARAAAEAQLDTQDGLALQEAHMTIELKPDDATKADAVARLMDRAPFKGTRPIFAGDDRTDVPAMALCQSQQGVGIAVGGIAPQATITLDTPAEVRALLRDWVR